MMRKSVPGTEGSRNPYRWANLRRRGFGYPAPPTLARLISAVLLPVLLITGVVAAQESGEAGETHERFQIVRDPDVPDLPFIDNPDPELCGIPEPFGKPNQAFLNGYYGGELIQSEVLLYDTHLRRSVVGSAPHGTEIEVILYQVNPELNYYLVRTVGLEENSEGWIPAPFVRFPGEPDPAEDL